MHWGLTPLNGVTFFGVIVIIAQAQDEQTNF